jgi:hypothetical protein
MENQKPITAHDLKPYQPTSFLSILQALGVLALISMVAVVIYELCK